MREREQPNHARDDDNDNDDGGYLSIEQLARYSSLSTRTLQRYLTDPVRPMPHLRMPSTGKRPGRVLVERRAFDQWIQQFKVGSKGAAPDDVNDTSWLDR